MIWLDGLDLPQWQVRLPHTSSAAFGSGLSTLIIVYMILLYSISPVTSYNTTIKRDSEKHLTSTYLLCCADTYNSPAEDVTTHPTLFPWSEMQARLDCQDGDWAVARYRGRPEFGGSSTGEVSKVLGAQAERLVAGGQSGPVRQETISMVYHVVDGSVGFPLQIECVIDTLTYKTLKGSSRIGDKTFEWQKGDTFCIPSWCPYQVSHIVAKWDIVC